MEKAIELRRQLAQDLGSKDALQAELTEVEAAAAKELEWKTAELAEIQADLAAVAEIDTEMQATPELRLPKNQAALQGCDQGLAGQWQEGRGQVAGLAPLDKDLERLSQSAPSELAFLVGALEQPLPRCPRGPTSQASWTSWIAARLLSTVGPPTSWLVGGAARACAWLPSAPPAAAAPGPWWSGGLVLVLVGWSFFALQSRLRLTLAVGGLPRCDRCEERPTP